MMNSEFNSLTAEQKAAVRRVIGRAQTEPQGGQRSEMLPNGDEAYAYPGGSGTHWGINSASQGGFCTGRGIWPKGQKT